MESARDGDALLRQIERFSRSRFGARQFGRRDAGLHPNARTYRARQAECRLGAAAAPAAFAHALIKIRTRQPDHLRDIADRCECLFVKPSGFRQQLRRNFFLCDHD